MMHSETQPLPYERLPWQSSSTSSSDHRMSMTVNRSKSSGNQEGSEWAMTGIAYPGKHDVMLGRGGESNYHAGNLTFRSFIQEHKIRYQKARKQEKPIIALEVVLAWRDLSPPGRFLARIDPSRADSLWEDVGDEQACKRAGRTLGEKCSNKASSKRKLSGGSSSKSHSVKPTILLRDAPRSPPVLSQGAAPQGASDFISSFRNNSRSVFSNESAMFRSTTFSRDEEGQLNELLSSYPPIGDESRSSNKRRRLATSSPVSAAPAPSPDIAFSGARGFGSRSSSNDDSNKSSPIVSPDNTVRVLEETRVMNFLDTGDRSFGVSQHERTQMIDDLPTAEFLTQTVFMD